MRNTKIYTYSAKKDGLLKTRYYEQEVGENRALKEVDIKERFKKLKVKYNFDKDPEKEIFELSVQGKKFAAKNLIGIFDRQNGFVFSFTDKQSNQLYFTKDDKLSGPYQGLVNADNGNQILVIENGELVYLDGNLNKQALNCTYVNDHVVKNRAGKYAYMQDGRIITDFSFDSPNIALADAKNYESNGNLSFVIDKENKKGYLTKNGKVVQTIHEFEGEDVTVDRTDRGLYIVTCKNKTCVFDTKTLDILLEYSERTKMLKDGDVTVFSGKNDSFAITSKQTDEAYKYEFNHKCQIIPYPVTYLKNSCVQIMDRSGKCAIASIDENANFEILTRFNLDRVKDSGNQNRSKIFMPIVVDKKMGAYNTETKTVQVTPFCDEIVFDDDKESEVKPGFHRFYFEDDGKIGVVNNHNNIEIEPILSDACVIYPKFRKFEYGRESVFINLSKPTLFAEKGDIVETKTTETPRNVTTKSPKYSEGEARTQAYLTGVLLGGLAATHKYNEMKDATVSKTKTIYDSKTEKKAVDVKLPEELNKSTHLQDTVSNTPEALNGKLLSVQEYLEILKMNKSQEMS